MTPEKASLTKTAGHANENDYAGLIGGTVSASDHTGKKDVVDNCHRMHSVKSGKKWQIFLYAKSRLEKNTILKGLGNGNIAKCLIACINSQPESRTDREADREAAKAALQEPMRALRNAIDDHPDLTQSFFLKAMFEAGEVQYLAILPSGIDQRTAMLGEKIFHVFDAEEAVEEICARIQIVNSTARNNTQTDAQKVVFRTPRTIGEIEVRTDPHNYRRVKMWMDSTRTLNLLRDAIPRERELNPQVLLYGKAKRLQLAKNNKARKAG